MNNILIVEDEMLARIGIKSLISGSEKEYVVVGEAENGKKALEIIEELHPDIVITDIKMPVMNGLELIKQAKKLPNPPDFIVLSSYDDFEYVKQALVLGAKDYFLKLELSPEHLTSTLDRVCKERSDARQEQPHLKQSYVEHLSSKDYEIVKNIFLKEIIQGNYYKENEIEQKLIDLGITLPQDRIQAGVILLNGTEIHKKYADKDFDLFQFSVQNIISEIVSDYRYAYAVFTQSKEITVLYAQMDDEQSLKMEELMEAILKALKTYLNITGLIGISTTHAGYSSIKKGYKEALDHTGQHHLSNGITESAEKQDRLFLNVNEYIKQFDTIIQISDRGRLKQCLDSIVEVVKGTYSDDKHVVKSLCSALLLSLSSYVAEQQPMFKLEETWGSDPYHSLDHLYTNYDYIVWIQRLERTTALLFNTLSESRKLIHQAKQFIQSHYAQNISLEVISEELNISPNYLSHLFRKEAKESVVEYITRYRIDEAKRLLRTTHYKVYEVGKMVGYESEQYFSRVFKKVVGMPPAKYKM